MTWNCVRKYETPRPLSGAYGRVITEPDGSALEGQGELSHASERRPGLGGVWKGT